MGGETRRDARAGQRRRQMCLIVVRAAADDRHPLEGNTVLGCPQQTPGELDALTGFTGGRQDRDRVVVSAPRRFLVEQMSLQALKGRVE